MITYGGSNINHFSDDKKISGVDGHDLCDKLFAGQHFCSFFFFFCKKVFRHIDGIPMEPNCAPLITDLVS
jgi:hypothetical protein